MNTPRTNAELPAAYLEMELLCRYFEGYFQATQMAHTHDNGMVVYLTRNLDDDDSTKVFNLAKQFKDALRPADVALADEVALVMQVFSKRRLMLNEKSAASDASRIWRLFKSIADAIQSARQGGTIRF